jgi:hypothetical protein
MKYLRAKVAALIEHTGYNEERGRQKADETYGEEQASDDVEIAAA